MSEPAPGPAHRRSGDGWVELPDGRRFWGRAGAAGVLAVTPDDRVLLQHRIGWSHFGGTWGLPGGARDLEESALAGALREAREETGIDTGLLRPRFASLLDLGAWSYTTVAAAAPSALPVAVSDRESIGLAWVALDAVGDRELHPGLAADWPRLRAELGRPDPVLVVDAANVVGSRPDGWWRDRAGAAERLLTRLAALAVTGVPADPGPIVRRWPTVVVVLEGDARAVDDRSGLTVVRAERAGDDAIAAQVEAASAAGRPVSAITADRALADRVRAAGGDVLGPTRLLELLPAEVC